MRINSMEWIDKEYWIRNKKLKLEALKNMKIDTMYINKIIIIIIISIIIVFLLVLVVLLLTLVTLNS